MKGVVELHGGTISAASEGLGRGATFTIRLPLASPVIASQSKASMSEPRTEHGRRLLVIEDNLDSANSLRLLLELRGHTVQVAGTGPAGIQMASELSPEIVICDVGLPGMDGYAVASALRRLSVPPKLIIAVTGHGSRDEEPNPVFDYYLLKPVDIDRILRLLVATNSCD